MALDQRTMEFFDADAHVLEHPTEIAAHAPAAWADRVWHVEQDTDGVEWVVQNGNRQPANPMALVGMAGMSAEDRAACRRGELRYSEIRPAAYDVDGRLAAMTEEGIDTAVVFPSFIMATGGNADQEWAAAQCRAYNRWASDHVSSSDGRLYAAAVAPQLDTELGAQVIREAAELPGIVMAMLRPNPTADWLPMNDPVYDPLWAAATDVALPIGMHPFVGADVPGTCQGLRLDQLPLPQGGIGLNPYFAQALASPFDMMNTIAFVVGGGVLERHPALRVAFLESNGGWIVPWLERLDHHFEIFGEYAAELTMKPSEYFRRQCWISFDADESTLALTAESPLVGSDRMLWASDYPHPDAKYPGVIDALRRGIEGLSDTRQREVAGASARDLFGLS
jgi:uncharacterized protein